MNAIDFEQLQNEINHAENYLRVSQISKMPITLPNTKTINNTFTETRPVDGDYQKFIDVGQDNYNYKTKLEHESLTDLHAMDTLFFASDLHLDSDNFARNMKKNFDANSIERFSDQLPTENNSNVNTEYNMNYNYDFLHSNQSDVDGDESVLIVDGEHVDDSEHFVSRSSEVPSSWHEDIGEDIHPQSNGELLLRSHAKLAVNIKDIHNYDISTRSTASTRNKLVVDQHYKSPTKPLNSQLHNVRHVTKFITTKRVEDLLSHHAAKRIQLADKQRDQVAFEMKECTFKPSLSVGTNIMMSKRRHFPSWTATGSAMEDEGNPLEVSHRLFLDAAQRAKERLQTEKQINEALVAQHSFSPIINPLSTSKYVENIPLYDRVAEVQRESQRQLNFLRHTIDMEHASTMTFKPQINTRKVVNGQENLVNVDGSTALSSDVDGLLNFQADVSARLINKGKQSQLRKQLLLQKRDEALAEERVMPEVSTGTKSIARNNPFVSASFAERQLMLQERQLRQQERQQQEYANMQSKLFKPTVTSKSSEILFYKHPQLLKESISERVSRMTYKDADDMLSRRRILDEEIYGALRFQPSIDPISKVLGRDSSVLELSENYKGKSIKSRLQREYSEKLSRECTFQPEINELSRQIIQTAVDQRYGQVYKQDFAVTGYVESEEAEANNDTRISSSSQLNSPSTTFRNIEQQRGLNEKEEIRRAELLKREIQELQECTFRPAVKPYRANNHRKPVVVRGLDRHLELQKMSVKLKEEMLQREREVFSVSNVDKYRRAEDGTTIVQTFAMH